MLPLRGGRERVALACCGISDSSRFTCASKMTAGAAGSGAAFTDERANSQGRLPMDKYRKYLTKIILVSAKITLVQFAKRIIYLGSLTANRPITTRIMPLHPNAAMG